MPKSTARTKNRMPKKPKNTFNSGGALGSLPMTPMKTRKKGTRMSNVSALKPPQMRCMMPMTLLWSWGVIEQPSSDASALDGQRHGVPAAEAERGEAASSAATLHLVEHRRQKARARLPYGVSERDRAAVDVHLLRVKLQLAYDRDGLNRERLVQLYEVNFAQRPAGLAHNFSDGLYGGHHHEFGLDARSGLRHDARQRLDAERACALLRRDDDRRRAVVDARRVASRDRAALPERGPQLRECFERRVFTNRLVGVETDGRALLLRNLDEQYLVLKLPRLDRGGGLAVRGERVLVLLLARNIVALGDDLARVAHVVILERAPQAVVNHRVNESSVAHA